MKHNQGFTLIELIIVIVILGILAVTAAPKFLNLAGDARAETLKAVQASLQSANNIINAKAILQGVQNEASANVLENGENIAIVYGYVAATDDAVTAVLDLDSNFTVAQGVDNTVLGITAENVVVYPADTSAPTGDTAANDACVLIYTEAAEGTKPTYGYSTAGC